MGHQEIKEEIRRYLKTSENENTTFQKLQDTAKGLLREKFIVRRVYLKI